ncbi:uncharacterized protein METZ01_LOCUS97406, partial [marine metagenome]
DRLRHHLDHRAFHGSFHGCSGRYGGHRPAAADLRNECRGYV